MDLYNLTDKENTVTVITAGYIRGCQLRENENDKLEMTIVFMPWNINNKFNCNIK